MNITEYKSEIEIYNKGQLKVAIKCISNYLEANRFKLNPNKYRRVHNQLKALNDELQTRA